MRQKRLDFIMEMIEIAAVCSYVHKQFTPKTQAGLINAYKYPTPEFKLRNQILDEFKIFFDELPLQIKKEIIVMNAIGCGDFTLEHWDECMEWCVTDVKEPEIFIYKSEYFSPTNLTRFFVESLLHADGHLILKLN